MIPKFELAVILFLIFMMYVSFVSYKRKQLSGYSFTFWITVWVIGIVAVIYNPSLNVILKGLNVTRIFDLYTLIGFMFFIFMLFYLFRIVKKSEQRIEELVRIVALQDADVIKPNNSKKTGALKGAK